MPGLLDRVQTNKNVPPAPAQSEPAPPADAPPSQRTPPPVADGAATNVDDSEQRRNMVRLQSWITERV